MSDLHPRQRLSLFTNAGSGALSHDVSAALKASLTLTIRTHGADIRETPAPPPSPVDFGYSSRSSFTESESDAEEIKTQWEGGRREEAAVGA